MLLLLEAASAAGQIQFTADSYDSPTIFKDFIPPNTMAGLAFDGTYYYSAERGSLIRVFTASGSWVRDMEFPHGVTSAFIDQYGRLLVKKFGTNGIYWISSIGITLDTNLWGPDLPDDIAVVLNGDGTEFVAHDGGIIRRWSLGGDPLESITLDGYGTLAADNHIISPLRMAAVGDFFLTFGGETLSAWNSLGQRFDFAHLVGSNPENATATDYSLSYADGKVWLRDTANDYWQGYSVDFIDPALAASTVSEPISLALLGTGLAGIGAARRRRRKKEENLV